MKQKFLYYISIFTILLGFFLTFLVTYWLIYPYKTIEFKPGNGTFIEDSVKSGGYLRMLQDYCKYTPEKTTISRQFIDGVVYQVPIFISQRPAICSTNIEYIYVPKALPQGEYKLRTVISVKVNPLRRIDLVVETASFKIVKEDI